MPLQSALLAWSLLPCPPPAKKRDTAAPPFFEWLTHLQVHLSHSPPGPSQGPSQGAATPVQAKSRPSSSRREGARKCPKSRSPPRHPLELCPLVPTCS